jgi:hypothetical protein
MLLAVMFCTNLPLNVFCVCGLGYFSSSLLISSLRTIHCFDFNSVTCEELMNFEIPFIFEINQTGILSCYTN